MNGTLHPRFAALRSEPSSDAPRDPARLARIERTRVEMLAQGAAIAATLQEARAPLADLAARLATREIREVAIIGCGDSWFAGQAARPAFRRLLGVPVDTAEAFDHAMSDADLATPGTLIFGLSASGTTPVVNEALARARQRGAFGVGVTNTAGSTLHTAFDAGLLVRATRSGWPTQSTTAAIALLITAAAAIAAARRMADEPLAHALQGLPELADRVTHEAAAPMREAGAALAGAGFLAFTGAGAFAATAAIGAAKIRELGPVHAVAWPLEEMHHYRAQKAGDPLVLLAPDAASRARALDTAVVGAGVGGRTVLLLGAQDAELAALCERHHVLPPLHPLLAPLLFAIPLHLLAHAYATARAEAGLGYPGAW
jgi:glutamine---fructose-6-phosphate transaminase (isomerizing)